MTNEDTYTLHHQDFDFRGNQYTYMTITFETKALHNMIRKKVLTFKKASWSPDSFESPKQNVCAMVCHWTKTDVV